MYVCVCVRVCIRGRQLLFRKNNIILSITLIRDINAIFTKTIRINGIKSITLNATLIHIAYRIIHFVFNKFKYVCLFVQVLHALNLTSRDISKSSVCNMLRLLYAI